MSDADTHFEYIDQAATLERFCADLAGTSWLALDTEFIREKTYRPQLCLLQVAAGDRIACIDPLALADLGPLMELLYDPARVKVLHAARQDLEIFHLLEERLPEPVFDTQLAATLLGCGDQVGYASLVKTFLDVTLDKDQVRTDWSQRPLSPEQLRYAADDVRYLARLYPLIEARLESLGRGQWLAEDFAALSDPAAYQVRPAEAWRRVSGAHKLRGAQLAVLQTLAEWREKRAQEQNRPRKWVLADQPMLDLARLMPDSPQRLARIRGLEPATVNRVGAELLARIGAARRRPSEEWPSLAPRIRLTPDQEALIDALAAILRLQAAAQGVSAAALANRRELERLVGGDNAVPVLHGWRRAVAGEALQDFLQGRRVLAVEDGRAQLLAHDEGAARQGPE